MCYLCGMRNIPERALLTISRREGAWTADLDGAVFSQSDDKEEVKAAANRRAREIVDTGRLCQVRVSGEHGFFA